MKFSVGYQLAADDKQISAIKEHKDKISEIYFSWEEFPNGRNTLSSIDMNRYLAREKQENDLSELLEYGFKYNLLLNGNCYGKDAQSRAFFMKIGDTVEHLKNKFSLKSVTTTSLLIAKFLKQNFKDLEVRASVNMGVDGSVGMDYIAEYFDSFYLKREYNRDINKLRSARTWCNNEGKKLYGLANSGCLNFCSAHTFHDNLVAHESEIAGMDNAYVFEGQCHLYLKNKEKCDNWLRISNFIRPEDIYLYESFFDGVKLATRTNSNPAKVISAYCKGSFSGAVTDLLEPNHSGSFYPQIIENKKIPDNFTNTVLHCTKDCENCVYCRGVQQRATVTLEEFK